MRDTWPMHKFFREVRGVLEESVSVIHYRKATELALARLPRLPGLNMSRQIEDVREKMYEAGQYGLIYLRDPYFAAVFPYWLAPQQPELVPDGPVWIGGNAACGVEAMHEGLMRAPYMVKKTNADDSSRNMGMARGLVVQRHVQEWFRRKWPQFYHNPDNDNDWTSPCDHDFRLVIDGQPFRVDVFTENCRGECRNPGGGKRPADFHLYAVIHNDDVIWQGVFTGADFGAYAGQLLPWYRALNPLRMVFWLNCLAAQPRIDHADVRNRVHAAQAA